jgi:Flp pilus assembly protein TadB
MSHGIVFRVRPSCSRPRCPFHGSAARLWNLTKEIKDDRWRVAAQVGTAIIIIPTVWTLVLAWYVIFGLLVVPYRLIRRGQRRREMESQRHRESLQYMAEIRHSE